MILPFLQERIKVTQIQLFCIVFNEALGCTISHFALIAVLDNILGLKKSIIQDVIFLKYFFKNLPAHQFGFFFYKVK